MAFQSTAYPNPATAQPYEVGHPDMVALWFRRWREAERDRFIAHAECLGEPDPAWHRRNAVAAGRYFHTVEREYRAHWIAFATKRAVDTLAEPLPALAALLRGAA